MSTFFADDPNRGCAPGKADPDDFFRDSINDQRAVIAEHCGGCPVKMACRDWAITTRPDHGVWGGLTRRELVAAIAERLSRAADEPKRTEVASTKRIDPEYFDRRVAELHAAGRSDRHIGFAMDVHASTVQASRARQGLPTLYGPGGRRLKQAVGA